MDLNRAAASPLLPNRRPSGLVGFFVTGSFCVEDLHLLPRSCNQPGLQASQDQGRGRCAPGPDHRPDACGEPGILQHLPTRQSDVGDPADGHLQRCAGPDRQQAICHLGQCARAAERHGSPAALGCGRRKLKLQFHALDGHEFEFEHAIVEHTIVKHPVLKHSVNTFQLVQLQEHDEQEFFLETVSVDRDFTEQFQLDVDANHIRQFEEHIVQQLSVQLLTDRQQFDQYRFQLNFELPDIRDCGFYGLNAFNLVDAEFVNIEYEQHGQHAVQLLVYQPQHVYFVLLHALDAKHIKYELNAKHVVVTNTEHCQHALHDVGEHVVIQYPELQHGEFQHHEHAVDVEFQLVIDAEHVFVADTEHAVDRQFIDALDFEQFNDDRFDRDEPEHCVKFFVHEHSEFKYVHAINAKHIDDIVVEHAALTLGA